MTSEMVLGVCGNAVAQRDGKWYTHHTFGRIVERIAPRVRKLVYYGAVLTGPRANTCDFPLAHPRISVHPMDAWQNSLEALKRPDRRLWQYWKLVRSCEALFLRGTGPLIWTAHWMARARGQPVVHWFGSNPARVLGAERRGYGRLIEQLGLYYACFERAMTRVAARASRAYLIANGAEVAQLYRSGRTIEVVSTSITDDDFLLREDTCTGKVIRILFVGFIRAEKGIEFLVRALPLIESRRPIHLALVGSWDQFPVEYQRLRAIIKGLGWEDRISWEGYAAFGPDLFAQMDRADLLVAPSLSEGTPRVLVEARARSLPVISTRVGGIPSSVSDGEDGLLVPPRDPPAIARAVSRIIADSALRQRLIRQGRERVRTLTIDRFVDLVMDLLTRAGKRETMQPGRL